MKILVVGSGGREHAIVWKLKQSKRVDEVFVAPGNVGMASLATCLPVAADDMDGLLAAAKAHHIDLTVVGPEKPLTMGIVDVFEKEGLRCFGPSEKAAELEGSKAFSKALMQKYGIPTAAFGTFTDATQAKDFLRTLPLPVVVKADGLAAGKGVVICENMSDADKTIDDMLIGNSFGEAGSRVVIEEFLTGQEVSVLAFADGKTAVPMVSAQDHKRIFDGDKGPNTGGMGAYSPAPIYTEEMAELVTRTIIQPTIDAMAAEGRLFKGILYTGLMLTADGPKVLEYNVRFGDPETQPVLMRMTSDLVDAIDACIDEKLTSCRIDWMNDAAACVVLAAKNYPASPRKGDVITGLDQSISDDVVIFHAGTAERDGQIVTNGGRVLGVTGHAPQLAEALEKVYKTVAHIDFDGMQYRHDIGAKALAREG